MQIQQNSLRTLAPVIIFLSTILFCFGVWLVVVGRGESFRMVTGFRHPVADFFFKYVTHLGDGIFILGLTAVLALRKKYFLSMGIAAGYLLSGVFAQLGKKLLNMPRPKAWFANMGETVYQVPGVEVHLHGSFPSGHTASAFALAVFLLFSLPYRWYSWLILAGAFLVGYSRIYLSQHFPVDVWAGACIGTLSGIIVFWWLEKKLPPKYRI